MAESHGHDLVSKQVAIQYGLLVAGTVLLMIATWNWYQQRCDAPPVYAPKLVSNFASHAPAKVLKPHRKSGKLTEGMLHEGFMNYGAESDENASPADPVAESYDPAGDSLDKSVFDSHKEFVDESYGSSTGPSSANIERDDTNEVVKRWGLRKVDYTSVYSSDDARTVSSEYPEQVEQKTSSAESELF